MPASCVKLTCKTPVAAQIYNVKSSLAVRSKASTKRSIYYKINQKKVRVKKGQDIKVIKEKTCLLYTSQCLRFWRKSMRIQQMSLLI